MARDFIKDISCALLSSCVRKSVFYRLFWFCKDDSGILGKDVFIGPTGTQKPCSSVREPPNLYIGLCRDHCPGTVNPVFVYVSGI